MDQPVFASASPERERAPGHERLPFYSRRLRSVKCRGDGRSTRRRTLEALEQDRAFHFLDRLGHLDAARTGIGAVEGRPAAEAARLLRQDLHPFTAGFVARVEDEPVGVHDRGGADVAAIAPENRAIGTASGSQYVYI